MAKRAGRSVVTTGATAVGAAEATIARATAVREDRRSFILSWIEEIVVSDEDEDGVGLRVWMVLFIRLLNQVLVREEILDGGLSST